MLFCAFSRWEPLLFGCLNPKKAGPSLCGIQPGLPVFFCSRQLPIHPLARWDLGGISYLIEDVSYFAMLSCMVLLTIRLCSGILPIKLHMSVYTFTALMAVSPVIFTYALFPGFPSVVNVYGTIVYTSKLMVSLYLILLAFLGAVKEKSSVWLLAGNAVFGFGLFTDLWTGGAYEPLCFG